MASTFPPQLLPSGAPHLVPRPRTGPPCSPAHPSYAAGFFLFLVANAVVFVRPSEFVPGLIGLELYLVTIVLCLLCSFPVVLTQLAPARLERRPVTVCVLALLVAVVASLLARGLVANAWDAGVEFAKAVLYYLLLTGLVCTPARLRRFLFWLPLYCAAVAALTVSQWHGVLTLPNLKAVKDSIKDASGGQAYIDRLQATGIFQDPNDLSVLLAVAILLCLYWLADRTSGLLRALWLLPLGVLGYALLLTQSRGGFLALLVGLLVFLRARFGWLRTLLLGGVLLPGLFVMAGSRQTSLSTAEESGQGRIQLWSDGLMALRAAPLLGVGKDRYVEEVGQVAHNSYLHALTELGFLGGSFFVGAFFLALVALIRLGSSRRRILDPDLRRLHPVLTGVTASYMAGMLSLSLCYVLPTLTILGVVVSYQNMTRTEPPLPPERFDHRLWLRLVGVSVVFFVAITLFVRLALIRG